MGRFSRFKLPFYKGYYPSGVVQYSSKLHHFRTLKLYGKNRTEVLDQEEIVKYDNLEDRQSLIDREGLWKNYIVSYRASD